MLGRVASVINEVKMKLPQGFPDNISQPIFEGLRAASKKLIKTS